MPTLLRFVRVDVPTVGKPFSFSEDDDRFDSLPHYELHVLDNDTYRILTVPLPSSAGYCGTQDDPVAYMFYEPIAFVEAFDGRAAVNILEFAQLMALAKRKGHVSVFRRLTREEMANAFGYPQIIGRAKRESLDILQASPECTPTWMPARDIIRADLFCGATASKTPDDDIAKCYDEGSAVTPPPRTFKPLVAKAFLRQKWMPMRLYYAN